MEKTTIAIKIDVDTDRGTRIGVPNLLNLFAELDIPATFLFSLGPDNTGRAIKRVFRPGFLKKVQRSSIVSLYGIRTLLNGTLLPAPHIGKRNAPTLYAVHQAEHEVGIHCYDHIRWQDGLASMQQAEVNAEFMKARNEFERIFQFPAKTAGAAGWQANAYSLAAYDKANLLYASDMRGTHPFFPRIDHQEFKTLQIPTTLPTLDELLGRPEYPETKLIPAYIAKLREGKFNTFTAHAEIEGMKYIEWFKKYLVTLKNQGITFVRMDQMAQKLLKKSDDIPICNVVQGSVDGRSGTMAIQSPSLKSRGSA